MGIFRRVGSGKEVLLSAEHVIGRMPSCRLCVSESFVSLAHAMVRYNGQHWELRDLGSTNGTLVDGKHAPPGESVPLHQGAIVSFGDERESWELVSAVPPGPAAIPLDGGEPRFLDSGVIALPDTRRPLATIHADGDRWLLETAEAQQALTPGQTFTVGYREWRLECPAAATSTNTSSEALRLSDVSLLFGVSSDEEHITLSIRTKKSQKCLGERACFYLAFVLARQRQEDRRAAVREHGWLDVETVLQQVPEYGSYSSLNVEIYRFRRLLSGAGIEDGARGIERRRGQVRLGTDRVEFHHNRD